MPPPGLTDHWQLSLDYSIKKSFWREREAWHTTIGLTCHWTDLPLGLYLMSRTGCLKLKWCRTTFLCRFTSRALPSESAIAPGGPCHPKVEITIHYYNRGFLVLLEISWPSSTVIISNPLGETVNRWIFFRFSKGKVKDLLLSEHARDKTRNRQHAYSGASCTLLLL